MANIRNSAPKTFDEKIARVSRKITKAIQSNDADDYFRHLVDWAFIRANHQPTPHNLTFLKDASRFYHERTLPKEDTSAEAMAELASMIQARFEQMNSSPNDFE